MTNKLSKISNRISNVFNRDKKKQSRTNNTKHHGKNFTKKKQIETKTFKMVNKENYSKQKNKLIKQKKQIEYKKNKKRETTQMFRSVIP